MHFGATLRVMRLESGLGLRELACRELVKLAQLCAKSQKCPIIPTLGN